MADVKEIRISPVAGEDRDDWLELWQQWQAHMHGEVPETVSLSSWTRFLAPASGLHCLIARNTGGGALGFATVGLTPFAWTATDVAFLQDLYVSEPARGQGIGSLLLKGVYDLADKSGATQVFWMVDEKDSELQDFYARHAIRTPYLRYMRRPWPW